MQLMAVRMAPDTHGTRITRDPETPITCPGVIVINRGYDTITHLETQICLSRSGALNNFE